MPTTENPPKARSWQVRRCEILQGFTHEKVDRLMSVLLTTQNHLSPKPYHHKYHSHWQIQIPTQLDNTLPPPSTHANSFFYRFAQKKGTHKEEGMGQMPGTVPVSGQATNKVEYKSQFRHRNCMQPYNVNTNKRRLHNGLRLLSSMSQGLKKEEATLTRQPPSLHLYFGKTIPGQRRRIFLNYF